MNLSYNGLYQSLAEHDRQAMDSWSYSMPEDDWVDSEEWIEEDKGEPPRELTPEQIERMSKEIQRILKEGKERGEEKCKGKVFTYRGIPL